MPVSPERLQRIRSFPELINYLRDELDWPTDDFEFEDLTFEYEPAELGLKDEEAVKVKTIHQLRPLHNAQPWGIFFVEFGKKRIPIVVLRRILRHLVFKKRASAKSSERPAWQPRDLLFISATGDDADRELTFAHFVERADTGLAELRVLGWDTDDTPLHMGYVARTLSEKLRWHDRYETDPEAWRREWSSAFLLRHRHVIRTSGELSIALAELARNLRSRIRTILRAEDGFGEIRKLQRAFQSALIHDLDDDGFADMFAQTVTYGLFSVSVRRTFPGEGTALTKDDVPNLIFTSPFLKEMLGVFLGIKSRKGAIDFDELGVSDVTDLLTSPDTHMEVVLADFNNKTRGEDPVIHFYEHFLSAYNKQLKIQRGVFYTPQPVVSYIVRSVHELLQTEFGLEDGLASTVTWGEMIERSERGDLPGRVGVSPAGLGVSPKRTSERGSTPHHGRKAATQDASLGGQEAHPARAILRLPPLTDEPGEKRTISPDEPFVQILDPATGTATFLVEVIDVIHRHLGERWKKGGLAVMPALPSATAPAAPPEQAGGLPEISRGSSERRERTPPIAERKRSHPGGVPESPAHPTIPAPLRGTSVGDAGSGGIAGAQPPANLQQPSGLPLRRTFAEYWNQYVPSALLPRLHAFELMMAPYAIAHMKIGLKLAETGYRFGTEERARIYLTNALEPWVKQLPLIGFDALAHEAAAVNEIKRHKRFTVVIGNPPYSGVSANNSETAVRLVDAYKFVDGEPLGERKHWLQDDYKKFVRVAQIKIETAGAGIVGFITNHGYLDDPTARGMRRSLMQSFPTIHLLDAHGSLKKREVCPDGTTDQNVFDIEPGVAIGLLQKAVSPNPDGVVKHAHLWGLETAKSRFLGSHQLSTTDWSTLDPRPRFYLFTPSDSSLAAEYEKSVRLVDVFSVSTVGCVTARDGLTIHWNGDDVWQTVTDFVSLPVETARTKYGLGKDVRDWTVDGAQRDVRASGPTKSLVAPVLYRPFDQRFTYYTGQSRGFIGQPQPKVMRQFLRGPNLGLSVGRQGQAADTEEWSVVFCTKFFTEFNLFRRGGNNLNPLYAYPADSDGQRQLSSAPRRNPNLTPSFLRTLAARLGLRQSGEHGLPAGLTPEDIFHYAYAVFHSPGYRSRYAEFLKIDFPRLPLTGNLELFRALARLGGELTALHLLESPRLAQPLTEFILGGRSLGEGRGGRNPEVEKVSWSRDTVWVDKAQTTGFRGVREDVWNFHIGGYQVCQKWLKDRKGRTLTKDDIAHYHKIVVALSETIRLMAEIDKVIEKHGGWPGAFNSVPQR